MNSSLGFGRLLRLCDSAPNRPARRQPMRVHGRRSWAGVSCVGLLASWQASNDLPRYLSIAASCSPDCPPGSVRRKFTCRRAVRSSNPASRLPFPARQTLRPCCRSGARAAGAGPRPGGRGSPQAARQVREQGFGDQGHGCVMPRRMTGRGGVKPGLFGKR